MQHVYETLYTFDAKSNLVPMLAEGMPKVSADGKVYSIALRKGVKLHSGRELDADDVVASLKRWMDVSPRGKSVQCAGGEPDAKGPLGVEITLKNAYAPLLAQLAMPSGMAAIMAKESLAQPLKEYRRHRPVHVQGAQARPVRAADPLRRLLRRARSRPTATAASATAVVDELRFVPVPNANTRVEGALAGQFHYRRPAAHRGVRPPGEGTGQGGAAADAVVRLPLSGVQHQGRLDDAAGRAQGRAGGARRGRDAGRRLRRHALLHRRGQPLSRRARRSIPMPAPPTTTSATPRRPRRRPSRPATRASRCASSPAGSTTSTTTWR